jgi:catechol 2,3-dioxygenase
VNLFVADLARSVDFYTRVGGLDVVFEEPGIAAVFLSNGTSHHDLALMEVTDGERVGRDGNVQVSRGRGREPGLNHLGWEMPSEAALVDAIRAARAAGVRLHRTVDHQISRSAYLFDPDGTYLEFYADDAQDWRRTYADNTGALITGAWDPDAAAADPEPRYATAPVITVLRDAALHPVRTARATLAVADPDRAVRFATEVCGLTVLHRDPAGAVLGGTLGLPDLTLVPAAGRPAGLRSFGLELPDPAELEAGRARARAAGAPVVADAGHSLVLADPDGICVEFLLARRPATP